MEEQWLLRKVSGGGGVVCRWSFEEAGMLKFEFKFAMII